MKSASIILLLILAGCASQLTWEYPAGEQQAFYRDRSQCEAMAESGGNPQIHGAYGGFMGGYNLGSAIRRQRDEQQIFNDCMRGHGYTAIK